MDTVGAVFKYHLFGKVVFFEYHFFELFKFGACNRPVSGGLFEIGVGKGNPDWNYSAPHGAGRVLSRKEAFEKLQMNDFKREMDGIWSTCVCECNLDESPMAYKPMREVEKYLGETVEITDRIVPVYNFKASS